MNNNNNIKKQALEPIQEVAECTPKSIIGEPLANNDEVVPRRQIPRAIVTPYDEEEWAREKEEYEKKGDHYLNNAGGVQRLIAKADATDKVMSRKQAQSAATLLGKLGDDQALPPTQHMKNITHHEYQCMSECFESDWMTSKPEVNTLNDPGNSTPFSAADVNVFFYSFFYETMVVKNTYIGPRADYTPGFRNGIRLPKLAIETLARYKAYNEGGCEGSLVYKQLSLPVVTSRNVTGNAWSPDILNSPANVVNDINNSEGLCMWEYFDEFAGNPIKEAGILLIADIAPGVPWDQWLKEMDLDGRTDAIVAQIQEHYGDATAPFSEAILGDTAPDGAAYCFSSQQGEDRTTVLKCMFSRFSQIMGTAMSFKTFSEATFNQQNTKDAIRPGVKPTEFGDVEELPVDTVIFCIDHLFKLKGSYDGRITDNKLRNIKRGMKGEREITDYWGDNFFSYTLIDNARFNQLCTSVYNAMLSQIKNLNQAVHASDENSGFSVDRTIWLSIQCRIFRRLQKTSIAGRIAPARFPIGNAGSTSCCDLITAMLEDSIGTFVDPILKSLTMPWFNPGLFAGINQEFWTHFTPGSFNSWFSFPREVTSGVVTDKDYCRQGTLIKNPTWVVNYQSAIASDAKYGTIWTPYFGTGALAYLDRVANAFDHNTLFAPYESTARLRGYPTMKHTCAIFDTGLAVDVPNTESDPNPSLEMQAPVYKCSEFGTSIPVISGSASLVSFYAIAQRTPEVVRASCRGSITGETSSIIYDLINLYLYSEASPVTYKVASLQKEHGKTIKVEGIYLELGQLSPQECGFFAAISKIVKVTKSVIFGPTVNKKGSSEPSDQLVKTVEAASQLGTTVLDFITDPVSVVKKDVHDVLDFVDDNIIKSNNTSRRSVSRPSRAPVPKKPMPSKPKANTPMKKAPVKKKPVVNSKSPSKRKVNASSNKKKSRSV